MHLKFIGWVGCPARPGVQLVREIRYHPLPEFSGQLLSAGHISATTDHHEVLTFTMQPPN